MDVSIIIVSYNTKKILANCLDSIYENTKKISFEIIVVDNGSIDGTVEYLKKQAKSRANLKIILNDSNHGFAKANNQAIKLTKGRRILLLNSDTIINKGMLGKLIDQSAKSDDEDILVPRLLNSDKTVQPSCYHFPTPWGAVLEFWFGKKGRFLKYYPNIKEPVVVDAAVGAAFLIPRGVLDKVGLLDEKYFLYFEDIDYCKRARSKGVRVVYLPMVEVIHLHGESGKKLNRKPNQWLIESSKRYHGNVKYEIITLVIKLGRRFLTKN